MVSFTALHLRPSMVSPEVVVFTSIEDLHEHCIRTPIFIHDHTGMMKAIGADINNAQTVHVEIF